MQFKDFYTILPPGNQSEFSGLNNELIRRGVSFEYVELQFGGRIYCIPSYEMHKMPHDDYGPYLGDDRSGHSLYATKKETLEENFQGRMLTGWIKVQP